MRPRSLSASALQTAGLCLARYKAENVDRTPSMGNSAASTGTAVHYALEMIVNAVCIQGKKSEWNIAQLRKYYQDGFVDTFHHSNFESDEFADGWELCQIWFKRSEYLLETDVISCEVKSNFPVPMGGTDIPLNYIWDRCDRIDDETIRVVDYKTIRRAVTAQDLRKKIQPRVYALAAQIQFPEAKKIWVQYDLLRHEAVGRVFTREDNAATWRFLKREAARILDSSELDPPETLNPECHFCIRKVACKALEQNAAAGGISGITTDQAAKKKLIVAAQLKALTYLDEELDNVLLAHGEDNDLLEWESDDGELSVKLKVTGRRGVSDPEAVAELLGDELARKYGYFKVGDLDRAIKSGDVPPERVKLLKAYMPKNYSEPTAQVELKSPLEE